MGGPRFAVSSQFDPLGQVGPQPIQRLPAQAGSLHLAEASLVGARFDGGSGGGTGGFVAVGAAQVIGQRGSRSEDRGVQAGGGVRPSEILAQVGQLQLFFQGWSLLALEERRRAGVEGEHTFANV